MVDSVITKLPRLLCLYALLAFPSAVLAHRLDEYLQATLVAIEPGGFRFQINLTPGVAVAQQVLALIDRDRDGVITTNEAIAYAESLRRDLLVQFDQHNVELRLAASHFPEADELRTGLGIIQMEFLAAPGAFAAGHHKLSLDNRHLPAVSVYLFNAAQPRSASVQITRQKRNENQSTGDIVFEFRPPPNPSTSVGVVVSCEALCVVIFVGLWHARRKWERAQLDPSREEPQRCTKASSQFLQNSPTNTKQVLITSDQEPIGHRHE